MKKLSVSFVKQQVLPIAGLRRCVVVQASLCVLDVVRDMTTPECKEDLLRLAAVHLTQEVTKLLGTFVEHGGGGLHLGRVAGDDRCNRVPCQVRMLFQ